MTVTIIPTETQLENNDNGQKTSETSVILTSGLESVSRESQSHVFVNSL